jgi:hypothetical protein
MAAGGLDNKTLVPRLPMSEFSADDDVDVVSTVSLDLEFERLGEGGGRAPLAHPPLLPLPPLPLPTEERRVLVDADDALGGEIISTDPSCSMTVTALLLSDTSKLKSLCAPDSIGTAVA